MGDGASFALGSPMFTPQGRRGLFRLGITEAPAAWARGPTSLWDHRGPRRMGEGASLALGSPRPLPHGRGGLLRLGTIAAPRRMGDVASLALGPPRPPPHGRGGLGK